MSYWFIFATTLLEGRPKYELEDSIIGNNPGLGFRPMPPESNVESTLVWYQKHTPNNSKYWVDEINLFLEGKLSHQHLYVISFLSQISLLDFKKVSNKTVNCRSKDPGEGESCKVDLTTFGPCTEVNEFGYEEGKPCIFLKLNKIYGWNPEYY
jgi:sodium/potassium-transporting ATPase subunit beta